MDPRETLVKELGKKYGSSIVFKMNDRADITQVKVLPTGSLALDLAIGVGGFPRGRIIEIFGPEGDGKSLLLLSIIAQTQVQGGHCAFIDVEHALTPDFAKLLGVDTQNLYYAQPDSGKQALEIMEELIKSCLFDIVGLDSVAALITKEELEAGYDKQYTAATAIMMAKALKRLVSIISKTKTVAVFINQLREKPMTLFGSPEYTPGGRALKFYSSLRIEVKRTTKEVNESGRQMAHTIKCTVLKNKVAPPFGSCHIRLDYRSGIDKIQDACLVAQELGIIGKRGSWYYWKDEKWNGEDGMRQYFTTLAHLKDLTSSIHGQAGQEGQGEEKAKSEEGKGEPSE